MKISIIVAIGKNNEIGKKNSLLWHMPNDLKHFKEITSGKTIIMGRKTFESIGRPLPNRKNIVITRDNNYKKNLSEEKSGRIEIAHSLKEALNKSTPGVDNEEIFIIGGGEIYKQAMNFADKLYITEIHASFKEADTFFPEIIPIIFGEEKREKHKKDATNPYDYDFVEYKRF